MKINIFFKSGILGDLVAVLSGMLLTLAFAPFGIYPLAVVSPAILLALWHFVSPRTAFWRGFLFGLGLFGSGVYWVYISIHTYGKTSSFIAFLITSGLIAILALFPAFNGFLLNRFFQKRNLSRVICAFPAIWVLLEWVRSWIFSGFPWLFLGYSQANSPLKGFAPYLSVYGISLALLVSSGLLFVSALSFRQNKFKNLYYCLLGISFIWTLGGILNYVTWTKPEGEPIKVSLLQGNIEQNLKWSPDQVEPTLKNYLSLTEKSWGSKIIIWPEASIPVPLDYAQDFINLLDEKAKQNHAAIILGLPVRAQQPQSFYNAVITLGEGSGVYVKHRLVPFGEYIPSFSLLHKIFNLMQIPMSEFIPGLGTSKPIQVGNIKISTFICYEIAFPERVLTRDKDINIILTVSNDAWFDGSIAQAQHLEMAQMRALELQRPVLFVSNTGITAFINADGKVLSQAPQNQTYVLTDNIQPKKGRTPLQLTGIDPALILITLFFWIGIRSKRESDIPKKSAPNKQEALTESV